jgi:membrane-associated protease RseP (regulator of RpoE activity)
MINFLRRSIHDRFISLLYSSEVIKLQWYISLLILAAVWFLIYIIGRYLKLEEKYGVTLGPLILIIRTKRFNKFLERTAKKYARFWRLFGNISIFVGFLMMLTSFGALLFTLINTLTTSSSSTVGPTVGFIIPGVTVSFKTMLYLIIPIILTMVPHEIAHGVVSHADGVELKSTGLAFFAVFFGAFVEPEEESMNKSSYPTRMRTFAAGMFPNVILGLITIPLVIFSSVILNPLYHPADGILIREVVKDSPADIYGLERGIVITDIGSVHMDNYAAFMMYMNTTSPNQTLILHTDVGIKSVKLANHPDNNSTGYLGIYSLDYRAPKTRFAWKFFPYIFEQELFWTLVVSFGAVLFNALPIPYFLDGDKLLSSTLFHFMPKKQKTAKIILTIFRYIGITLFIISLVVPIVKFGFVTLG